MNDVLLLPNYNKADFLANTLKFIMKNPEAKNLLFLFTLDVGFMREVETVINNFRSDYPNINTQVIKINQSAEKHRALKQSWAIYQGYLLALALTDRLVFMLEDDIFVSNRFFNWHYQVQTHEPFVSIGTRNNNRLVTHQSLSKFYIQRGKDYQSLGVCWHKDNLAYILSYFTKSYWENPFSYVKRVFPNSGIGPFFCEQDGLIRRVIEKEGLPVAWPYNPAPAYHAGFFGKGRGKRLHGKLEDRIKQVEAIATDKIKMQKRILQYQGEPMAFYRDSIPVPLEQPKVILKKA